MPVEISAKVDTSSIDKSLRGIKFRLRHLQPAFSKSAKQILKDIDKRFDSAVAPPKFGSGAKSRWVPNRPATIAHKGHAKVLLGGRAARGRKRAKKGGALRRSMRATVRRDALTLRFKFYGDFHMTGYKTKPFGNQSAATVFVPARPFAWPSKRHMDDLVANIERYVKRGKA